MFRIADLIRRAWTAAVTRRHTDRCSPPPQIHRLRLGVDGLEDRTCPSIWLDTTGDHQAGTLANWNDGLGPWATGNAGFYSGANGGSDDDCRGLSGSIQEIDFSGEYPGTVTFTGPVTTQILSMDTGAISQQPGADLTITRGLDWRGGTLNSYPSLANVTVDGSAGGASADIEPYGIYGTGTVTTGSNLNFTNGASGTFGPGTVNFANGAGMDVGQNCSVAVNANDGNGQAATVTFSGVGKPWAETDKQITLQTGATVTVTGPGPWNLTGPAPDNNPKQLYNNGGTIELTNNATVSVDAPPNVGMYTVQQAAGTIKLHTGSTLTPKSNGLWVTGGTVQIVGDLSGGATVQGQFYFKAGTIEFTGNHAIFTVTDQVTWQNGTFKPRLDPSTNVGGTWDTWFMGSLVIPTGSTPTIAPVSQNYTQGQNIDASYRWVVIRIAGTVTTNNIAPVINSDGPGYRRFIITNPDNSTDWSLGCPDGH